MEEMQANSTQLATWSTVESTKQLEIKFAFFRHLYVNFYAKRSTCWCDRRNQMWACQSIRVFHSKPMATLQFWIIYVVSLETRFWSLMLHWTIFKVMKAMSRMLVSIELMVPGFLTWLFDIHLLSPTRFVITSFKSV